MGRSVLDHGPTLHSASASVPEGSGLEAAWGHSLLIEQEPNFCKPQVFMHRWGARHQHFP